MSRLKDSPTILFVDDEASLVALARHALEPDGYEVLGAETGEDAARLFADRHQDIDAVVVDLVLPDMAGADLTRRLMQIDSGVPVIITSGHDSDRADDALAAGAVDFIGKPFDLAQLTERLEKIIEEKPR